MGIESKVREIIIELKAVKKAHNLTNTDILELVEKEGYSISEPTIKKVFGKGSEDMHFRYKDTILPIQKSLLKIYDENSAIDDIRALKKFIRDKNELIATLFETLDDVKKDDEKRINFLKEQIQILNSELKRKEEVIDRKDETINKLLDHVLK